MGRKKKAFMLWEEAPDIITPEELSELLNVGIQGARDKFNEKGFPRISGLGNIDKADKEAARLYLQGNVYTEYITKTVSNRIQNEILKTLKDIKEMLGSISVIE